MREALLTLILLAAAAFIAVGVFSIYVPAGFLCCGVELAAVGWLTLGEVNDQ